MPKMRALHTCCIGSLMGSSPRLAVDLMIR
jgi:hypothetical protein